MDKYEIIEAIGEGSFGRVYKAKQNSDASYVALKVISKRGRSHKEIKGLRRECEIQRHLHHPNIIEMRDSFETDNEIVVITEFAHLELYVILGKEGYLPEERVQTIVWDLVSALYYLHSHRVLHRDLKPQNILLDSKNCAKLCDFGFARNMSTGTHVLTSIKGTPLYMAPELIEEHPYDHNADLWSLGCIIYELLVGAPPFCTTSILHLVRLIRHEQVQWPNFISVSCISFLQGLLQKDPSKRLTWPEILVHPFVEGHILIMNDDQSMSLTRPLSVNTMQAKEQQKKEYNQKNINYVSVADRDTNKASTCSNKSTKSSHQDLNEKLSKQTIADQRSKDTMIPDGHLNKLSQNLDNFAKKINSNETKPTAPTPEDNDTKQSVEIAREKKPSLSIHNWNWNEETQVIESDEWVAFLQRSMLEVMNHEFASLCQPNLTYIVIHPLRNSNASCKVQEHVANFLSLPYVIPGISKDTLSTVKHVYLDVKLVPNLVYASKLLTRHRCVESSSSTTTPSPTNATTPSPSDVYRSLTDLSADELKAIESIYVLVCHLVHSDVRFVNQFCDAVAVLNVTPLFQQLLLLSKRKHRIVPDIFAILTQVLRKLPENADLVENVILLTENDLTIKNAAVDFVQLLRNSNPILRERVCCFLKYLGRFCCRTLQQLWKESFVETLEALMYDSMENVRNAAESAIEELKLLTFYNQTAH